MVGRFQVEESKSGIAGKPVLLHLRRPSELLSDSDSSSCHFFLMVIGNSCVIIVVRPERDVVLDQARQR
jgi:hypothetical protein